MWVAITSLASSFLSLPSPSIPKQAAEGAPQSKEFWITPDRAKPPCAAIPQSLLLSETHITEDQGGLCSQQPTGHRELCSIHESLECCSFLKTYGILPVPIIPQYLEQMHLTSSPLR